MPSRLSVFRLKGSLFLSVCDRRMKEVEIGHHSVLLTRHEGKYSALGNQCTHYGAPLSQGVVSGNRVRCPWHGSCFNICTGDLEEFPGIDSLPCHKVQIGEMASSAVPGVAHTILLLGGGIASLMCAETLRQEKFGGRIIMVSRDHLLPYDKTRLSKVMNVESDTIVLRRMEFYHQYDIEVWLRKEVLSVDTDRKTVAFDDGLVQNYDQLLISTGCRAKALDVPGHSVYPSFLLFLQMLSEHNIKFYMNDIVTEIKGVNGKVKEVVLKSGKVIPTDVLIVGIGSIPNSAFLQGTKIQMNPKKLVIVDKYMRTNVPDVFCAGDLATFPLAMAKNQLVNIGHWQMAQAQGSLATYPPFTLLTCCFYSDVIALFFCLCAGYGEGYTELVMKGNIQAHKFLALYLKNDEVIAAAGLNFDPAVSAVAERLSSGKVITKKEAQYVRLSSYNYPYSILGAVRKEHPAQMLLP
uniref:Apoptosis inducing factor mitochondria associated 5 n=1 Tax=Oryzias sinensis TaxID=183150 RepID=A0A8C7XCI9_9TELE